MGGLSQTLVIGEGENVAEAIVKATVPLTKLHLNPEEMAARLHELLAAAARLNAEQEALKRALKAKTVAVEAAFHELQVTASGYLDIILAAVDKDSDEAKNFRRIRSRMFRPAKGASPLPVAPAGQTR